MSMDDELNQLRAEVTRLRRQMDHLLRVLGQEELPGQSRPEFLLMEAEVISVRQSRESMPIVIKAQEDDASIYLNDREGRARGIFQVDAEGSARFEIWNKDQQLVVSIGETAEGGGEIYVASPDGKPRAGMKVHGLGGVISAQNSQGMPNALLAGKDEGGTIVVAGPDGRAVAEMTSVNGSGTLAVKKPGGGTLAALTGKETGGAVAVFGEAGAQAAELGTGENGGTLTFFDAAGQAKPSIVDKLQSLRGLVGRRFAKDEDVD